ncbi:MAG TPA: HD-GYP domain-containing protein [Candidatus Xenobia bacterium]
MTLGAIVVVVLALTVDPGLTWRHPSSSPTLAWMDLLTFAVLAAAAELWTVYLPGVSGSVDVSDSLYFALMLLCRPGITVGVLVVAALVKAMRGFRQPEWSWQTRLFSAVAALIPFGLGTLMFDALQRDNASLALEGPWGWNFLALLASSFLVYGLLSIELAWYRVLDRGIPFYPQMLPLRRMGWQVLSMMPLGLLLAVTREVEAVAFYLLVIPLIVMFVTLKDYSQLLQEARETIEGLANAVERRNPSTLQHSDRVARYAEETARELRMREEEVEAIRSAGKLHDLGKISVADRILVKMDALDEEEFEAIRRSPEVGGRVAGTLSIFQASGNVGELVHQHHEWFNGQGYPRGLQGDEILQGARILAVAEAFDSMTTDRIYREPMTVEGALAELQGGAGQQFDPQVVDAFHNVIKRRQAR